jgi:TonB-linked SusC/RagA family outer membrane protein
MKLTTFLLFVFFFQVSAGVFSQNNGRLSLKAEKESVNNILKLIEEQTEFRFMYNANNINIERKVDLNCDSKSITEVLDILFKGTNVKYRTFNSNYVLYTDAENAVEQAQQQKSVSGKVTDSSGAPLPGVSVVVKGTTSGVITDADGKFTLAKVPENATLQFSFVGMKSQEVIVKNKPAINVSMTEESFGIDEVVAIGYGTSIKKNVTGNQSTIKSEELKSIPTSSLDAALQGKGAGIDITSANGGMINGLVKVRIRGNGSINSGTQPLWVVDGIPIMSDEGGSRAQINVNDEALTPSINFLSDLNFDDVESVNILKDAAATAIYGSRGANGVILVTTKSGKQGKGKIDFDYKRTFSNSINQIKLMGAKDWIKTNQTAWANDGRTGDFPLPVQKLFADTLANGTAAYTRDMMNNTDVNWMNKMLRTGITDEYSLSMSNATDKSSYFVSGNYSNISGIMIGQEVKKYSIRVNLDFQPIDWLKVGTKSSYACSDANEVSTLSGSGVRGSSWALGSISNPGYLNAFNLPVYPEKYADGTPFEPGGLNAPYQINDKNLYDNTYKTYHLVGMAFLEFQLLPGLTFRTEAGLDNYRQPYNVYGGNQSMGGATTYWLKTNYVREGGDETQKTNFNAVFNYNKVFKKNHDLRITLGTERTSTQYKTIYWQNWNVTTENHLNGAASIDYDNKGTAVYKSDLFDEKFEGFFGRLNYSFKEKYLFGFSIRRDGSNKFGPNNRFGVFPSLSAGWIISDEHFFKNEVINLLKLRGSYGQTGNSNIQMYKYQNVYSPWGYYNDEQWLMLLSLGNKGIQWEKSNVVDFGLEFGLLNNRISGSISYYNKLTSNMLLNSSPAPSIPAGVNPSSRSLITNAGGIKNTGFELTLSTINIVTKDFKWTTDFNFSTNSNKVTSLDKSYAGTPFSISGDERIAILEGHPIGEYVLTQFAGYTNNGDDKIYQVNQDLRTNSNQYQLESTGNSILATASNLANNRFFTGKSGIPKFFGGIGNSFSYKGISLDLFVNFRGGNYILLDGISRTVAGEASMNKDLLNNTWTSSNTNAKYPRLSYNGLSAEKDADGNAIKRAEAEDRYLVKGDFVRLKNVRLGYSIPKSLLEKAKIKSLMIYTDIQNLLTFSHLHYFDPEISSSLRVSSIGNGSGAGSLNYAPSLVSGTPFPNVSTVQFGIKLGL